MDTSVTFARQMSIRDAGHDEFWLQKYIYDNPACLGLGELESLQRERTQPTGGRLDILLKDPADDAMYELELMLGETDETHIVRMIEYWDNEKRRWPQRQHFAVLVAEHINRRFFNVIHLLSHSIPIIAIQVALIEGGSGREILFFTKVLDTYEEIDDGTSLDDSKVYTRDDWIKNANWTVATADKLLNVTSDVLPGATLNYLKYYIAVTAGNYNVFWLHKRGGYKTLLRFRVAMPMQTDVAALLDARNISYVTKPKRLSITVDQSMIEKEAEMFQSIAKVLRDHKSVQE